MLLGKSKEESPVWADLGGRIEKGETVLEGASREFLEESRGVLQLDLNNTTEILITDDRTDRSRRNTIDQVILTTIVEQTEYNMKVDDFFQQTVPRTQYEDEMSYLEWILLDDFLRMDVSVLSKFLQNVRQ